VRRLSNLLLQPDCENGTNREGSGFSSLTLHPLAFTQMSTNSSLIIIQKVTVQRRWRDGHE